MVKCVTSFHRSKRKISEVTIWMEFFLLLIQWSLSFPESYNWICIIEFKAIMQSDVAILIDSWKNALKVGGTNKTEFI